MTNILFISSYSGLGGGETSTLNLAKALPANIQPHLLVPADGSFAEAWRSNGWQVHIMPWRGATVYFVPFVWAQLPIRYKIERLIHEYHIDLIHSDYHTLPMALPAAKRAGIPLVWTCMGWWFQPKRWQYHFFSQVDLIFAHSEAIKTGFLGTPPFMPPAQIEVLYPGVDTERFSPRADGQILRDELGLDDCPIVVMMARFQDVKGHDTFIRMALQVIRRIPEVHFVVAGENTQSAHDNTYKDQILAMAQRDPNLWQHIHYIGHRDDTERVLAAADVVVCASDFEGFGMVNVEAMASAKAIVSTNRGGPAETIVDGVTGYLVPPKDSKILADRVIELIYSDAMRQNFGMAGRLRAQQIFNVDVVALRFMERITPLLRG